MKLVSQAKFKLAKILKLELGSISTNKGELYFDGDVWDVDTEVFSMDNEGNYVLPEDGDYTVGNQVITVIAGVITEIKEPSSINEDGENLEDIPEDIDGEVQVSEEEFRDLAVAVNELVAVIESVVEENAELKKMVKLQKKNIDNVNVKLSKLSKESNGTPIPPNGGNGDINKDTFTRFMSAGRG